MLISISQRVNKVKVLVIKNDNGPTWPGWKRTKGSNVFVAVGNHLSPEKRGKFLGTAPFPDCENSHFLFSSRQDREFLEPHC